MTSREVTILLAEDDDGHARLIEKNLRRAGVANPIVRAVDGQQTLDFLKRTGTYAGTALPWPLLVLLDLNMPIVTGLEVLKQMKTDERTRRVPVVILTTTDDVRDVNHCYDLGCNVYVTKPVDYEAFSQAVVQLGMLLAVVTIPGGEE